MKKKKILITGGSGTLGKALRKKPFLNNSFFPSHKEFNINEKDKVKKFLIKNKIKLVINCAAIARMSDCEKNPYLAFETNVKGVLNIIDAINEIKNIKLVQISTDGVYPSRKGNYKENSKLSFYNFYGLTKVLAELIVKHLRDYIIIRTRFFNKNKIKYNYSAINSYSSSLEVNELAEYIIFLIKKKFKGTINVGGKKISDYKLYKKYNKNIKKTTYEKIQSQLNFTISKDASLNLNLFKKILLKNEK